MHFVFRPFTLHSSEAACTSALKNLDESEDAYYDFEDEELSTHLFCIYAMDPRIKTMWECDWDSVYRNGMREEDPNWTMMDPNSDPEEPEELSLPGMDPRAFAVIVNASLYGEKRPGSAKKPVQTTGPRKQQHKPKVIKAPIVRRRRLSDQSEGSGDEEEEEEDSDGSDQDDYDEDEDEDDAITSEEEIGPDSDDDDHVPRTPSKRKKPFSSYGTPSKRYGPSSSTSTPRSAASALFTPRSTSRKRILDRYVAMPSLPARPPKISSFSTSELSSLSPQERAKRLLHVGATPDQLVCREKQYAEIFNLVQGAVNEGTGSCVYVSGVPGTGKTATVRAVARALTRSAELEEMDPFTFVEINGMKLPDAAQSYSVLWSAVSGGERAGPKQALANLKARYEKTGPKGAPMGAGRAATVVLVDELDQLVTGRQDVMYNLFSWPNTYGSNLVIIAVANTFDLPERLLKEKVRSRLGMHRIPFLPYEYAQLEDIVRSRLGMKRTIEPDESGEMDNEMEEVDRAATRGCDKLFNIAAITLAAKKVANVTGDARRMLDACRRGLEMAEETRISEGNQEMTPVTGEVITKIFQNISKSGKVAHIKALPFQAKMLLHSIFTIFKTQGKPEIDVRDVLLHFANKYKTGTNNQRHRPTFKRDGTVELTRVTKFANEEVLRLLARLTGLGLIVSVGVGCGPARAGGHARIMLGCEEADVRLAIEGDDRLRELF